MDYVGNVRHDVGVRESNPAKLPAVPDFADFVFRIDNERLERLPVRPFRAGLLGHTLEAALQRLLELHPEVLPGSQIDPGAEDPPRFALLRREMPIGSWSLDHVLVDQRGVLTLVEAKLVANPEARREVIGQIMEYAANAREAWASGRLRERATEVWQSQRKRPLDEVLREHMGADLDIEALWAAVDANLDIGHFRLLIASDELRPEVRRIIEYLNGELRNAEVYGLELKCYGTDAKTFVLVPRLVGRTQHTADVKGRDRGRTWTADRLREAYASISGQNLRTRLIHLLDWTERRDALIHSTGKTPIFSIKGRLGRRLFWMYPDGQVYWTTRESAYARGREDRDRLATELRQLGLVDPTLDLAEVVDGRNLARRLGEFTDEQFSAFMGLIDAVTSAPSADHSPPRQES